MPLDELVVPGATEAQSDTVLAPVMPTAEEMEAAKEAAAKAKAEAEAAAAAAAKGKKGKKGKKPKKGKAPEPEPEPAADEGHRLESVGTC